MIGGGATKASDSCCDCGWTESLFSANKYYIEYSITLDFGWGRTRFPALGGCGATFASSSEFCLFPNREVILSCNALVTSLDTLAGDGPPGPILPRLPPRLFGNFIGDGDVEDGIRVSCISISRSISVLVLLRLGPALALV
jgi:hypothetical protein